MSIHTIGDSHSYFGFRNIPNVQTHWLGPKLCFSVGRDGISIKNGFNIKEGDRVIFSFGEIDCRCHIHKHISNDKGYKEIINSIVENYFIKIKTAVDEISNLKVFIYNVVPPVEKTVEAENPEYPFLGTDEERKQYTLYFNKTLKEYCSKYNYGFFDIYDKYTDANGFLTKSTVEINIHIGDPTYLKEFIDNHLMVDKLPPNLIGLKYTWGTGYITFNGASTHATTWGSGNYKWLNKTTMEVNWAQYSHVLVFNSSYNEYAVIRNGDLIPGKGSLCGSEHIAFLKLRGFSIGEQSITDTQVKDLICLTKNPNINVLEIGFDTGYYSDVFLKNNQSLLLTSFNLEEREYTSAAKEYITKKYSSRHTLIVGDITESLANYSKKNAEKVFDVIFIHGIQDYNILKTVMETCMTYAHRDTIIALNDVLFEQKDFGPPLVWTEYFKNNMIIEVNRVNYKEGQAMAWGYYILSEPGFQPYNIVGKRYTWGNGAILYQDNGNFITSWGKGKFNWLNSYTLLANFKVHHHVIKFNSSYSEYIMFHKNEYYYGKGELYEFVEKKL